MKSISTHCGGKDRLYRNTLLFLVGTARGITKLRQAHRERAALEGVRVDYSDRLDDEQREDLRQRLGAARRMSLEAVGPAYTVALRMHGHEVDECPLSDARRAFQEHLGYVWTTLVDDEEWILRRVGPVTLESTGLIPKEGGLRLNDGVEAFLRFTDKPIVATRDAVTAGLAQACAGGLVGIGQGGSPSALISRHCKTSLSLDPSEDGLWIIPPFSPEAGKDRDVSETAPDGVSVAEPRDEAGTDPGVPAARIAETATEKTGEKNSAVQRFVVRGHVPVESWGDLFRCFVGPAARMNLKKLRLGVQFEMDLPEAGALSENDPTLNAMKEAARQLGLNLDVLNAEGGGETGV